MSTMALQRKGKKVVACPRENCAVTNKKFFWPMVHHISLSKTLFLRHHYTETHIMSTYTYTHTHYMCMYTVYYTHTHL